MTTGEQERESLIQAMVRLGWRDYEILLPYVELANAFLSFRSKRVKAVVRRHGLDIAPSLVAYLTQAFEIQRALDRLPWHKRLWRRLFK